MIDDREGREGVDPVGAAAVAAAGVLLAATKKRGPSDAEARAFTDALRESRGRWTVAKELVERGVAVNARRLRRIAEASNGEILGTPKGYKLAEFATPEDFDHAEARMLSQAKLMTKRAVQIRRARNRWRGPKLTAKDAE